MSWGNPTKSMQRVYGGWGEKILMSNKDRLRFLYIPWGLPIIPGTLMMSGGLSEVRATTIIAQLHNLSCWPEGSPRETKKHPVNKTTKWSFKCLTMRSEPVGIYRNTEFRGIWARLGFKFLLQYWLAIWPWVNTQISLSPSLSRL